MPECINGHILIEMSRIDSKHVMLTTELKKKTFRTESRCGRLKPVRAFRDSFRISVFQAPHLSAHQTNATGQKRWDKLVYTFSNNESQDLPHSRQKSSLTYTFKGQPKHFINTTLVANSITGILNALMMVAYNIFVVIFFYFTWVCMFVSSELGR